jgi:hypothetical protein
MNVHVINLTKSNTNLKTLLDWCSEHYGYLKRVNYPAMAELHRVSYDDKVTGILVLYFREESDFFFFTLRWQ